MFYLFYSFYVIIYNPLHVVFKNDRLYINRNVDFAHLKNVHKHIHVFLWKYARCILNLFLNENPKVPYSYIMLMHNCTWCGRTKVVFTLLYHIINSIESFLFAFFSYISFLLCFSSSAFFKAAASSWCFFSYKHVRACFEHLLGECFKRALNTFSSMIARKCI